MDDTADATADESQTAGHGRASDADDRTAGADAGSDAAGTESGVGADTGTEVETDTDGGVDADTPRIGPDGIADVSCARAAIPEAEVERIDETISHLLSLLGKAHTMAVLREFADSDTPLRFSEIEDSLGISPNTLSERLKELTAAGLLTRTAYNEIPPRVEYEATDRARALFPIFGHLAEWARTHELDTVEG
jgi:DNA-binding HxlR family transcriptional regulator